MRTRPSSATATTCWSATALVKVLSMKEPPSQTFALLLQDLYDVPGEFIACLEWQRIPQRSHAARPPEPPPAFLQQARVARELRVAETRPEEMLVDDSASATVRQLGDALTETGGERPLLRAVLADARAPRRQTRARCSTRPPRR